MMCDAGGDPFISAADVTARPGRLLVTYLGEGRIGRFERLASYRYFPINTLTLSALYTHF
jgi:hypothetical protein